MFRLSLINESFWVSSFSFMSVVLDVLDLRTDCNWKWSLHPYACQNNQSAFVFCKSIWGCSPSFCILKKTRSVMDNVYSKFIAIWLHGSIGFPPHEGMIHFSFSQVHKHTWERGVKDAWTLTTVQYIINFCFEIIVISVFNTFSDMLWGEGGVSKVWFQYVLYSFKNEKEGPLSNQQN